MVADHSFMLIFLHGMPRARNVFPIGSPPTHAWATVHSTFE